MMIHAAHEVVHRRSASTLRRTVERLPAESRRAMLSGLEEPRPIIAGAYSAGPAVCPALAAYRRGARTGYGDFAHAWDRYTRGRGVRQASDEELATLVAILQHSLDADGRRTHRMPGRRNGWAGRVREAEAILENGHPAAAAGNAAGHANGRAEGNGRQAVDDRVEPHGRSTRSGAADGNGAAGGNGHPAANGRPPGDGRAERAPRRHQRA